MRVNSCILSVIFLTASVPSVCFAWTVAADFEDLDPGEQIDSEYISGFSGTSVTSKKSVSGTQSAQMSINQGATGWGKWGAVINYPSQLKQQDELWFRVNAYFPKGFDYDAQPWLKFLRLHTLKTNGDNGGYVDWYIDNENSEIPFRWIYEGEQQWEEFGSSTDRIKRGRWASYEMYVKFDSTPASEGGNAVVRLWKNGDLLKEINDRITLENDKMTSEKALIFTWWNQGAPKTQKMYIDDVRLTTETPSAYDEQGNPMIGTGNVATPPSPPTNLRIE